MPTTSEQLHAWMGEPEGVGLELKEARRNDHVDKLAEHYVAMANEGGGKFMRGVPDRCLRRTVGAEAFAEPGHTEASLHDWMSHRIPVEEVRTADGRVLVVHVPPRLPGMA